MLDRKKCEGVLTRVVGLHGALWSARVVPIVRGEVLLVLAGLCEILPHRCGLEAEAITYKLMDDAGALFLLPGTEDLV